MRSKPIPRILLFIGLCVCLTSEKLWLKNALAVNTARIVFTSMRDGNLEIYVMDAVGGNQERLTNNPSDDLDPDWSPDGTKIAFVTGRDGGVSQIYVMDADGKNLIRLTDGPRHKWGPDWSPDGGKIAFTVQPAVIREPHIAVMDADGRNRERLEDRASEPSWSPDGGEIAFVSTRDGDPEIYMIGADGQGLERVTHDLASQQRPAFSPDGRRIAYMAHHEGFGHISVVDSDGRNLQRLTHNQDNYWDPAWSPDGGAIAYWTWDGIEDGPATIHLMTSNGRYIRQLSDGGNAQDYQPDISPVGLAVSPVSKTTTIWGRLKILFE